MEAYQVEKKVAANGILHLSAIPFRKGELVEVIVLARKAKAPKPVFSSLCGKVIEYVDPTEPVAQGDWGILS